MKLDYRMTVALAAVVMSIPGPAVRAADLTSLVRETLEWHPSVISARQQQAASAQDTANARWQYFPTPSASLQQGNQGATAAYDSKLRTISLQQPIWTGGRLNAQVNRALSNELVSTSSLEDVRQDLALRVLTSWSSVQSAMHKVNAYEKSLETHERLLKQVLRRREEGASADSDVLLARARLESVRADHNSSSTQLVMALEQLSQLTGRKVHASEVRLEKLTPVTDEFSVDEWVSKALERSPDVARAQARIQAQASEVAIAKAAFWPEVFGRLEKKHGDVNTYRTTFYIGMEASLGAGLSKQTVAAAAQSRLEALQSEWQLQRLTVTEQVRSDYFQWISAVQRNKMLEGAFVASVNVAESWSRQFLSGRKSWQEVMNAAREQALNEAQWGDVQAQAITFGKRLVIYADGVDTLLSVTAVKGH